MSLTLCQVRTIIWIDSYICIQGPASTPRLPGLCFLRARTMAVQVTKVPQANLGQPVISLVPVFGAAATAQKVCFVAPYNCTLTAASITPDTAVATDPTDYWTFTIEKADGTDLTTAKSTAAAALAVRVESAFTMASSTSLSAGDVVCLLLTKAASAASTATTQFLVKIAYQPR